MSFLHYRSLTKKGPWAEHLTSLPKRGLGAPLTVFVFNHERAPHHVYDLKPSKQRTTESPAASKSSPDGTQHSEPYDVTVSIL